MSGVSYCRLFLVDIYQIDIGSIEVAGLTEIKLLLGYIVFQGTVIFTASRHITAIYRKTRTVNTTLSSLFGWCP